MLCPDHNVTIHDWRHKPCADILLVFFVVKMRLSSFVFFFFFCIRLLKPSLDTKIISLEIMASNRNCLGVSMCFWPLILIPPREDNCIFYRSLFDLKLNWHTSTDDPCLQFAMIMMSTSQKKAENSCHIAGVLFGSCSIMQLFGFVFFFSSLHAECQHTYVFVLTGASFPWCLQRVTPNTEAKWNRNECKYLHFNTINEFLHFQIRVSG